MAENENTLPVPAGKSDDDRDERIELRTAIFELGIILESIAVGFEAVLLSPASIGVKVELAVLKRHFKQGLELHDLVVELLNPQIK